MSEGQTLHPDMGAYLRGLGERGEPEPGVFTLNFIRGLLESTDTLSQQVKESRAMLEKIAALPDDIDAAVIARNALNTLDRMNAGERA